MDVRDGGTVTSQSTRKSSSVTVSLLLVAFEEQLPQRLLGQALALLRLLHAVDTFPQGGLYEGHYAAAAVQRYRMYWLPLMRAACYTGPRPQRQRPNRRQSQNPPPPQQQSQQQQRHGRRHSAAGEGDKVSGPSGRTTAAAAVAAAAAAAARASGGKAVAKEGKKGVGGGVALRLPQPPLDVAWVWFLHRCLPDVYGRDLNTACSPGPGVLASDWDEAVARLSSGGQQGRQGQQGQLLVTSTLAFREASPPPCRPHPTQALWQGLFAAAAPQQPFWPPPPPGSPADLAPPDSPAVQSYESVYGSACAATVEAGQLLSYSQAVGGLLHSLLRPEYRRRSAMRQARARYARFWVLQLVHQQQHHQHQQHQQQQQDGGGGCSGCGAAAADPLVPAADMALFWFAHMSMSGAYRATCRHFEPPIGPGGSGSGGGGGGGGGGGLGPKSMMSGPAHLHLVGEEWCRAYARTKRLYEATYGELFDPPHTQYVPLWSPHPLALPKTPLAPLLGIFDVRRPVGQGPWPLRQLPASDGSTMSYTALSYSTFQNQQPLQLPYYPPTLGYGNVNGHTNGGSVNGNGSGSGALMPWNSAARSGGGAAATAATSGTVSPPAQITTGMPYDDARAGIIAGPGRGTPSASSGLALAVPLPPQPVAAPPPEASIKAAATSYTDFSPFMYGPGLGQGPSIVLRLGSTATSRDAAGDDPRVVRQPRCGGHALFVAWRLARGLHETAERVGIFEDHGCCGCHPGSFTLAWQDRRPTNRLLNFLRERRGWVGFENLPHSSAHPFLRQVTALHDDTSCPTAAFGSVHTTPWAVRAHAGAGADGHHLHADDDDDDDDGDGNDGGGGGAQRGRSQSQSRSRSFLSRGASSLGPALARGLSALAAGGGGGGSPVSRQIALLPIWRSRSASSSAAAAAAAAGGGEPSADAEAGEGRVGLIGSGGAAVVVSNGGRPGGGGGATAASGATQPADAIAEYRIGDPPEALNDQRIQRLVSEARSEVAAATAATIAGVTAAAASMAAASTLQAGLEQQLRKEDGRGGLVGTDVLPPPPQPEAAAAAELGERGSATTSAGRRSSELRPGGLAHTTRPGRSGALASRSAPAPPPPRPPPHPWDGLLGFTPGNGHTTDADVEAYLPEMHGWADVLQGLLDLYEQYGLPYGRQGSLSLRKAQSGVSSGATGGGGGRRHSSVVGRLPSAASTAAAARMAAAEAAAAAAGDAMVVPPGVYVRAQLHAWGRALCWYPCLQPLASFWSSLEPHSRRTLLVCTFVVPVMPLLVLLVGGAAALAVVVLAVPLALAGGVIMWAHATDRGCGSLTRQLCCLVSYKGALPPLGGPGGGGAAAAVDSDSEYDIDGEEEGALAAAGAAALWQRRASSAATATSTTSIAAAAVSRPAPSMYSDPEGKPVPTLLHPALKRPAAAATATAAACVYSSTAAAVAAAGTSGSGSGPPLVRAMSALPPSSGAAAASGWPRQEAQPSAAAATALVSRNSAPQVRFPGGPLLAPPLQQPQPSRLSISSGGGAGGGSFASGGGGLTDVSSGGGGGGVRRHLQLLRSAEAAAAAASGGFLAAPAVVPLAGPAVPPPPLRQGQLLPSQHRGTELSQSGLGGGGGGGTGPQGGGSPGGGATAVEAGAAVLQSRGSGGSGSGGGGGGRHGLGATTLAMSAILEGEGSGSDGSNDDNDGSSGGGGGGAVLAYLTDTLAGERVTPGPASAALLGPMYGSRVSGGAASVSHQRSSGDGAAAAAAAPQGSALPLTGTGTKEPHSPFTTPQRAFGPNGVLPYPAATAVTPPPPPLLRSIESAPTPATPPPPALPQPARLHSLATGRGGAAATAPPLPPKRPPGVGDYSPTPGQTLLRPAPARLAVTTSVLGGGRGGSGSETPTPGASSRRLSGELAAAASSPPPSRPPAAAGATVAATATKPRGSGSGAASPHATPGLPPPPHAPYRRHSEGGNVAMEAAPSGGAPAAAARWGGGVPGLDVYGMATRSAAGGYRRHHSCSGNDDGGHSTDEAPPRRRSSGASSTAPSATPASNSAAASPLYGSPRGAATGTVVAAGLPMRLRLAYGGSGPAGRRDVSRHRKASSSGGSSLSGSVAAAGGTPSAADLQAITEAVLAVSRGRRNSAAASGPAALAAAAATAATAAAPLSDLTRAAAQVVNPSPWTVPPPPPPRPLEDAGTPARPSAAAAVSLAPAPAVTATATITLPPDAAEAGAGALRVTSSGGEPLLIRSQKSEAAASGGSVDLGREVMSAAAQAATFAVTVPAPAAAGASSTVGTPAAATEAAATAPTGAGACHVPAPNQRRLQQQQQLPQKGQQPLRQQPLRQQPQQLQQQHGAAAKPGAAAAQAARTQRAVQQEGVGVGGGGGRAP